MTPIAIDSVSLNYLNSVSFDAGTCLKSLSVLVQNQWTGFLSVHISSCTLFSRCVGSSTNHHQTSFAVVGISSHFSAKRTVKEAVSLWREIDRAYHHSPSVLYDQPGTCGNSY